MEALFEFFIILYIVAIFISFGLICLACKNHYGWGDDNKKQAYNNWKTKYYNLKK